MDNNFQGGVRLCLDCAEVGTEKKGTHVVVIVLASDSNEGALLWSSLTRSLVPGSIDNERDERVCVSASGRSNDSEVCVHMCVCVCMRGSDADVIHVSGFTCTCTPEYT